jgi:hypothetical protein
VKINYPITSDFLQQESFRKSGHKGIDFYMKTGTELRSIEDGVVVKVLHLKNNVGNAVFVKWQDGTTAIYGHMDSIAVRVGDKVHAGEILGYSGHSGHVVSSHGGNGEHLHFGLKNGDGNFINPSPYIEKIQHMNDKNYVYHDVGQSEVMNHSYTLQDIMSQYMKDYASMLSEIKFNFINLLTSVDYSILIHHLQNLFQLFS